MKAPSVTALCFAVVLGAFAGPAAAQDLNVAATKAGTHVVSSSVGFEDAMVASLGYGYAARVGDRTVMLGGDVTLPWAKVDVGDFRLRVGGLVPVLEGDRWRLLARLMPVVRGSESGVNRMTNVGLEGGLAGGYYGRRWFAAAELGADWAALTYVQHSAAYRHIIYADAKDGWYRTTGMTLRAGLVGGYSFEAVDVVLRAGQDRDLRLQTLFAPLYVTLGFNARLPF